MLRVHPAAPSLPLYNEYFSVLEYLGYSSCQKLVDSYLQMKGHGV